MINWINSWKGGNKKEKYVIACRLGTLTILELRFYCTDEKQCLCKKKSCKCETDVKFRFMILNLGFEI
jgi:hypothetical protein